MTLFRSLARPLFAFCLLLAAHHVQAQFLAAPQGILDSQYDYRAVTPATSASGFVTAANAQGAARFFYYGDNIFGAEPTTSIYARALSRSVTHTYQSDALAASEPAFIAKLNTNGAAGFRFLGNQFYDGSIVSISVKDNSNAAYNYRSRARPDNASAFLTAINAEGTAGYQYQGDFIFTEGGNFVSYSLFARNTAGTSIYTYETLTPTVNAAALVTQANTQGQRNFRYRGDQSFGTVNFLTVSVYEKNNALTDKFYYEQREVANSSAAFLAQAGSIGANRFYFLGTVGFSAGPFAALYISVNPAFTTGFE